MATIYVYSGAVGTADGTSYTNAKVDFATATAADNAGDVLYVAHNHAESTTGALTWAFASTQASPSRVICNNTGNSAYTQTATATGSSNITITGCVHFSGITIRAGNGGSATQSILAGGGAGTNQWYKDCSLQLLTTAGGIATIQLGDETRTDATKYTLTNTTMRLGASTHRIKVASYFRWDGGSFVSGGVAPSSVFLLGARGVSDFFVNNVNFNNIGTAFHLVQQPASGNAVLAKFKNCTLPTSWTGSLWSAAPLSTGIRAEMYNCFIGTTKLRYWAYDFAGQTKDSTTVYRTGGAQDDGVGFSMRMASSADAEYPLITLEGHPIRAYVDSTSSTTLSVEIIHDSQGSGTGGMLQDTEVGLRVTHSGGIVETYKTDPMSAAVDAGTTSSATWTHTFTTPVKQTLSVTFTPTSKGEISIVPVVLAANKVVHYCAKLGS